MVQLQAARHVKNPALRLIYEGVIMGLNGRFEDLDLSDLFQILSLSKRSGVLTIARKDTTGRLVFKEGFLLSGSSADINKIGQTLLEKKLLTHDELEKALESQKIRENPLPLGSILLEAGAISKKDLEMALKSHLTNVVKNFLDFESGLFHFKGEDIPDKDPLLNNGLSLDFVLMEAARQHDETKRDELNQALDQDKSGQANETIQFENLF
ncbi:MAG: DUF4388 domain-containing protein [Nitrospiria bacterium]